MTHRELPEWPTKRDVLEHFNGTVPPNEWWGAIHELELATRRIGFYESRLRIAVECLRELSMHHLKAHDMTFKASGALALIGELPKDQP